MPPGKTAIALVVLVLSSCNRIGEDEFVARLDEDGDGVAAGLDCDDGDDQRWPGSDEVCNGIDDNCSGHVDDAEHCWTRIYRFERPITGQACWNTEPVPPDRCAGYQLVGEAFTVAAEPLSETTQLVQCHVNLDHYIMAIDSREYSEVQRLGYAYKCTHHLGYVWRNRLPPLPEVLPVGTKPCPLYRFVVTNPGHDSHAFSVGEPIEENWTCEDSPKITVAARQTCYDEPLPEACQ